MSEYFDASGDLRRQALALIKVDKATGIPVHPHHTAIILAVIQVGDLLKEVKDTMEHIERKLVMIDDTLSRR